MRKRTEAHNKQGTMPLKLESSTIKRIVQLSESSQLYRGICRASRSGDLLNGRLLPEVRKFPWGPIVPKYRGPRYLVEREGESGTERARARVREPQVANGKLILWAKQGNRTRLLALGICVLANKYEWPWLC